MRKLSFGKSLLGEAAVLLGLGLLIAFAAGLWNGLPLGPSRRAAQDCLGTNTTLQCADKLHRLEVAVQEYAQDNEEVFPPMQDAQEFQAALLPFVGGDPAAFHCPDTGLPYTPNAALSGKVSPSIQGDVDTVEVVGDSEPHKDGLRTAVFLDGHVEHGGVEVGDPVTILADRAKALSLAVSQYVQDNDGTFPPMGTPQAFQAAVYPYAHSRRIFNAPNGQPFVPNAALSGVTLASVADPASTVLFQDTAPYTGGAPAIAFVDGHVVHAGLDALSVPCPVSGGSVVTATVTLSGKAASDVVVGLSSSDSSVVRLHRAVVIPAGQSSATFTVNTYRSHTTKTVTLRASLNEAAATAPLTITGR